jgi:hypothetical protein
VVIHAALNNAALPANSFNKIFVFNLNVFWMDPADELREIARLLTPDGRFYIFHQPPFEVEETVFNESVPAVCVKASLR